MTVLSGRGAYNTHRRAKRQNRAVTSESSRYIRLPLSKSYHSRATARRERKTRTVPPGSILCTVHGKRERQSNQSWDKSRMDRSQKAVDQRYRGHSEELEGGQ